MSLTYLQYKLVDHSCSHPTEDGAQPVDPVVFPGPEDDGRPEGPGGVHAGASQGNGKQVASGDRKADGQGCRSLNFIVFIRSGSKDNQNQNKGDEEFNANSLKSHRIIKSIQKSTKQFDLPVQR